MKTFNYWKLGLWSVVLAATGAVFWWLAFTPAWYSSLGMPMTIRLDRPSGATPIKAVWLTSSPWRHENWEAVVADGTLAKKWAEGSGLGKPESVNGDTINYQVPGDDCRSELGIVLGYSQSHHLLLIAELTDGRFVGTIADIPDARATREMHVTLP